MSKTAPNYKTNKTKSQITADSLRQKLKLKHLEAANKLKEAHPHVHEFFKDKGIDPGKLREHSAKILGTGLIAGSLLLRPPIHVDTLPSPNDAIKLANFVEKSKEKSHNTKLTITPNDLMTHTFESLNTIYGKIGAEQHLRRYPGDTLSQHGSTEDQAEGMAPGLGAWGYFAPSKEELTEDLIETEKWYAVVQTLYLPDWNTRQPHLKNWYKHRKVMIVNTENGNAVVAAIADSGPAAFTGKHFGGSPEVMDYLGGPRYKKGPVLLFFVDDPENEIPLGPVDYSNVDINKLASL